MKNRIALILKVIAYVVLAGGVIVCVALADATDALSLIGIVGAFVLFAFVRGFSEIIQLLQDIKDKTPAETDNTAPNDDLPDL